jgi:hypothetical protein
MIENTSVLLRQLIEARLERVHTWLPARIIEFSHTTLRATVEPTILKVVGPAGNETKLPFPLILEVPVDTLLTEKFGLRMPYKKDDTVTIGFYERSVEEILRDIEQRDPLFSRKHHLKDAIVVQGRLPDEEGKLRPFPDCWVDEWIWFCRDRPGTCIRLLPSGDVVLQVDPRNKLYLGSGEEGATPPEIAQDYAILGTRHHIWAEAHVHVGVEPGGGVTGPPATPPPATSEHVLIGE